MKRIYLIVLIGLSILSGWFGSALSGSTNRASAETRKTAFERVMQTKTLRCAYVSYPPYFEISAQTGKPVGIMVDMMKEVGRKLDVTVDWTEEASWATMLEGLNTGRYDSVCALIWQTPVRSKHAAFSRPFGYATVYSWVRTNDKSLPTDATKLNDKNIRIATMDGEISALLASELFPNAQTVAVPQNSSIADLFMNLVTGKADVVFQEENAARDFLKNNPGSIRKLSEKPLAVYPMTIAFPAGDTQLKAAVDSALGEILTTPLFDQILARYGGIDELGFKKPAMPYAN